MFLFNSIREFGVVRLLDCPSVLIENSVYFNNTGGKGTGIHFAEQELSLSIHIYSN